MDKRGSILIPPPPKPPPTDTGPGFWGVKTVAAIIDRTEPSVQRWWRTWEIPFFHQGGKLLVDPVDFRQWIEGLKAREAVAKQADADSGSSTDDQQQVSK